MFNMIICMFNNISIFFMYFILFNVTYNTWSGFKKLVDFLMDLSIWKFLPFEIVDFIFQQLPLSVLIKFQLVYKEWGILLENIIFIALAIDLPTKNLDLFIFSVGIQHNCFVGSYLNEKVQISLLLFPFLHTRYKIQCTVGSMIVFSVPQSSLNSNNYFIITHFTKTSRNLGPLTIGEWGFFSLLEKFNPQKYDWVVLTHVHKNME